jgi:hypothetical protein
MSMLEVALDPATVIVAVDPGKVLNRPAPQHHARGRRGTADFRVRRAGGPDRTDPPSSRQKPSPPPGYTIVADVRLDYQPES